MVTERNLCLFLFFFIAVFLYFVVVYSRIESDYKHIKMKKIFVEIFFSSAMGVMVCESSKQPAISYCDDLLLDKGYLISYHPMDKDYRPN